MSDDYLWDGSGDPDPEIERLESRLARYGHQPRRLELPERPKGRVWLARWWLAPALAAAALALVGVGVWIARRPQMWRARPSPPVWSVTKMIGSPTVAGHTISKTARLQVGDQLETDVGSRAIVDISGVGQLEVEPNSRLRRAGANPFAHRLALDKGVIHAMIWAPPGEFQVSTPSALAVDLGCAYTLSVDDHGAGIIRVTFGWVGFKLGAREAFIPEGAVCATRPGIGPGTPHFEDSSKRLSEALERLDFRDESSAAHDADLKIVLVQARPRDALTLWHLLARVQDSILSGDQGVLDLWWDKLGYGEMSLWRRWERQWTEPTQ